MFTPKINLLRILIGHMPFLDIYNYFLIFLCSLMFFDILDKKAVQRAHSMQPGLRDGGGYRNSEGKHRGSGDVPRGLHVMSMMISRFFEAFHHELVNN